MFEVGQPNKIRRSKPNTTFGEVDKRGVYHHHNDPLAIKAQVGLSEISKVMIEHQSCNKYNF